MQPAKGAITTANASPNDDVIDFSVTGEIVVNTLGALPALDTNIAINGPGTNALTVKRDSGAATTFRIFQVNSGKTVSISGLTISGGRTGSPFPDNDGGGIYNLGTLTISNSTLSDNTASNSGGGIHNEFGGWLTVSSSPLSDNTAGNSGGGIHNRVRRHAHRQQQHLLR